MDTPDVVDCVSHLLSIKAQVLFVVALCFFLRGFARESQLLQLVGSMGHFVIFCFGNGYVEFPSAALAV
jgi:hypothetical protein